MICGGIHRKGNQMTSLAPNPFFHSSSKGPCGPYTLQLLETENPRHAGGGAWPIGIDRLFGAPKSYFCWITGGHTFVEYEREYHYDSSETAHARCTKCNMWVPF
jgi:hypothetical protein